MTDDWRDARTMGRLARYVPDERFPHHVEGCICPRFKDIAPDLIADLTCPVHGVGGTDPGDVIGEGGHQ